MTKTRIIGVALILIALLTFAVVVNAFIRPARSEAVIAINQVPAVVDGLPQVAGANTNTNIGIISMLLLMGYGLYKENRNRKWDLQDRATARAELKDNQIQAAVLLARGVKKTRDEVLQRVAENTVLTGDLQKALIGKKGCTVGSTLEDIQKALEETKDTVKKTQATVKKAAATSADTNVIVRTAADLPAPEHDGEDLHNGGEDPQKEGTE